MTKTITKTVKETILRAPLSAINVSCAADAGSTGRGLSAQPSGSGAIQDSGVISMDSALSFPGDNLETEGCKRFLPEEVLHLHKKADISLRLVLPGHKGGLSIHRTP